MFTFLIFQVIPNGNPALRLAGRTATPMQIAAISRSWGFNKPVYVQYFDTMEKIFTGTVVSYSQQVNVLSQIRQGLPATASLAIGASVLWLLWGIAFGLLSARRPRGIVDRMLAAFSLTAISMPVFVVGSVLLYVLAFRTSLFPNGGYVPFSQSASQWFMHMVLPWFTLSLPAAASTRVCSDRIYWRRCIKSTFARRGRRGFLGAVSCWVTWCGTPSYRCCRFGAWISRG